MAWRPQLRGTVLYTVPSKRTGLVADINVTVRMHTWLHRWPFRHCLSCNQLEEGTEERPLKDGHPSEKEPQHVSLISKHLVRPSLCQEGLITRPWSSPVPTSLCTIETR